MKKCALFLGLMLLALSACGGSQTSSSISTSVTPTSVTSTTSESTLRIVTQPKDVSVNFGEKVEFEVIVNDEKFVKSYQWELLNVMEASGDEVWVDIDTASARSNKLVIPGPTFYLKRPYRCRITDNNDEIIYSDEVAYTLLDYYEGISYIEVGTRAIRQGQTLDLATTPYGTGQVSINEEGNKLTLNNVNFVNAVFDYDPFDSGVALYFMNYKYNEDTFTVELIGTNIIDNTYYEEDTKQGAIDLGFFFSGQGKKPLITIGGNGNLTTIGGSHAVYANTSLVVDADIKMNGIADHWNSGIHATSLVIEEDVRIFANLSSYLFEANDRANPLQGNIVIKKNAYIDAVISSVQDSTHGSALSQLVAIAASYRIDIEEATLNVNVLDDYRHLEDGDFLPPVEIIANHNSGTLTINQSNVNISYKTINKNDSMISIIANMISSSGMLNITDSNVNVMADAKHCDRVVGLLSTLSTNISTSNVYLDLTANTVTCLGSNYSLAILDSNVNVKGFAKEGDASGVVAQASLEVSGTTYLKVNLNDGIALGTFFDKGNEYRPFVNPYVCQYLTIDVTKIIYPSNAVSSIYSKPREGSGYQYYETIYDLNNTDKPLSEFIFNNK